MELGSGEQAGMLVTAAGLSWGTLGPQKTVGKPAQSVCEARREDLGVKQVAWEMPCHQVLYDFGATGRPGLSAGALFVPFW